MYLTLIFAIDLVEQIEPQDRLADLDLVSIGQFFGRDTAAIELGTVARVEVGKYVIRRGRGEILDGCDPGMLPRELVVIDTNVRLERSPEDYLFALKRDRHRDQLAAQKYKCRPYITSNYLGVVHKNREYIGEEGVNL